jgi:PAT family beta-lactamase induction signal transducer AmpG
VFVLTRVGTNTLDVMMTYEATGAWGWESATYSSTTGGLALVKVLGLVLGAALADRIGHVRGFLGCAALLVGLDVMVGLSVGMLADQRLLVGYLVANQLLAGMAGVAALALCMDLCHPRVAATQFTAYMALTNLSTLGGDWLGGQLADVVPLGRVFIVYASVQVVWLVLVGVGLDPEETRRRMAS